MKNGKPRIAVLLASFQYRQWQQAPNKPSFCFYEDKTNLSYRVKTLENIEQLLAIIKHLR